MCTLSDADREMIRKAKERFAALPPNQREKIERAVQFAKQQMNAANMPDITAPRLIPELTPEQDAADLHRDRLKHRVTKRVDELYARRLLRHPACGKRGAIHVSRPHQLGGIENMVYRTLCGRLDCPHCQRRRLCKTLKRAATCVLDAPGEMYLPRTEELHVLETTWREWAALDKAIRREHGGEVGRMRIRRDDDSVLIVLEKPFAGSTPMAPHLTFDLVEDAVNQLASERHAFRLLGSFSDRIPSEWKLIQRTNEFVNFSEAKQLLDSLGHRGRLFKTSELNGLVFRSETERQGNDLVLKIVAAAHPTAGLSEFSPSVSQDSNGETWTDIPEPTPPNDAPPIEYHNESAWQPSPWAIAAR